MRSMPLRMWLLLMFGRLPVALLHAYAIAAADMGNGCIGNGGEA